VVGDCGLGGGDIGGGDDDDDGHIRNSDCDGNQWSAVVTMLLAMSVVCGGDIHDNSGNVH